MKPLTRKDALCLILVLTLAAVLLSIGIREDYRLKHEDNNALYTTFARAHVQLGLGVTLGHDYFYSPEFQSGEFYAHHPPGIALVLAAAFALFGSDGPTITRLVAMLFQLSSLLLLFRLSRRIVSIRVALWTVTFFAFLPMGAFYGRMVNHEVLALPFIILIVDLYLRFLDAGKKSTLLGLVAVSAIGCQMGWVTFFAISICGVHAGIVFFKDGREHSRIAVLSFLAILLSFGAVNFLHIYLVKGGDFNDLRAIFFERIGGGHEYGPFKWGSKMLSFHRRLLSATGTLAGTWVLVKFFKNLRITEGVEFRAYEASGLFLLTGWIYCVIFNSGAVLHHYWQLPLLPGVAIALALAFDSLIKWASKGGNQWRRAIIVLALLEIFATSTISLAKRHSRVEDYAVRTVKELREKSL